MRAGRLPDGARVRVRRALPDGRRPLHLRTPWYVRGRIGVVERCCGAFANPEALAEGRSGLPELALYRVRFALAALWPDHAGPTGDTVDVELYEHWLEPAGQESCHDAA